LATKKFRKGTALLPPPKGSGFPRLIYFMKFVSWNVNGLRACIQKGFMDFFNSIDADIFAVQEIKLQSGQINFSPEGYHCYWNYAQRKGYSGVAVFSKKEPLNVSYGMGIPEHDTEGRIITLEFEDIYFVACYTPNSKSGLERLDYRMIWEDDLRKYLKKLDSKKAVVYCGDLNVAHNEIDLKNPAVNRGSAGFTDEERAKMTELLSSGFIDTFRYFYPNKEDVYSWWSYRAGARVRNVGWRIDYFIVSATIKDKLENAEIHSSILGSDHCPVSLDMKEVK